MRLYLKEEDKYLNVDFWSFMKCQFLTSLALTGIVYGVMIIILIIFGMLGLMVGRL